MKVLAASLMLYTILSSVFAELEEFKCKSTWWEDGYLYSERDTPNSKNRRCIVLEVWKKILHKEYIQNEPCSPLVECNIYPYDVTVELQKDFLKFERIVYPKEETTLTKVDDKTLKWEIDGLKSTDKYDGTFKLVVCFSGNNKLGKTSTLNLIKPEVNIGISGTSPCYEDDDEIDL